MYKFKLFPLVLVPDQPDQSGQDSRAKTLRHWMREGLKEHSLTRPCVLKPAEGQTNS